MTRYIQAGGVGIERECVERREDQYEGGENLDSSVLNLGLLKELDVEGWGYLSGSEKYKKWLTG